jgi:hypothetical protein
MARRVPRGGRHPIMSDAPFVPVEKAYLFPPLACPKNLTEWFLQAGMPQARRYWIASEIS